MPGLFGGFGNYFVVAGLRILYSTAGINRISIASQVLPLGDPMLGQTSFFMSLQSYYFYPMTGRLFLRL
jgi:hypothetical protein